MKRPRPAPVENLHRDELTPLERVIVNAMVTAIVQELKLGSKRNPSSRQQSEQSDDAA